MSAKKIVFFVACITLSAPFARGGGITYTCDSQLVSDGTCAVLNSTIAALYGSTFSDASASIYVQYGSTGLAENVQYFSNVSWTAWATALQLNASDATQVQAVNSLGGLTNNPVAGGDGVALTSALATALGLVSLAGSIGIEPGADDSCILDTSGCYNDIITVSSETNWFYRTPNTTEASYQYDIYSAIEHETDEALGTASCIPNAGTAPASIGAGCTNALPGNPAQAVSAADLFRFSAPGVRSFLDNDNGGPAYFSLDDGATSIAQYNNSPNGGDYGDWLGNQNLIQNAFVSSGTDGGLDITNDGGAEITVLNAVGYDEMVTPEPATWITLAAGLILLGALRNRTTRRPRLPAGHCGQ